MENRNDGMTAVAPWSVKRLVPLLQSPLGCQASAAQAVRGRATVPVVVGTQ